MDLVDWLWMGLIIVLVVSLFVTMSPLFDVEWESWQKK